MPGGGSNAASATRGATPVRGARGAAPHPACPALPAWPAPQAEPAALAEARLVLRPEHRQLDVAQQAQRRAAAGVGGAEVACSGTELAGGLQQLPALLPEPSAAGQADVPTTAPLCRAPLCRPRPRLGSSATLLLRSPCQAAWPSHLSLKSRNSAQSGSGEPVLLQNDVGSSSRVQPAWRAWETGRGGQPGRVDGLVAASPGGACLCAGTVSQRVQLIRARWAACSLLEGPARQRAGRAGLARLRTPRRQRVGRSVPAGRVLSQGPAQRRTRTHGLPPRSPMPCEGASVLLASTPSSSSGTQPCSSPGDGGGNCGCSTSSASSQNPKPRATSTWGLRDGAVSRLGLWESTTEGGVKHLLTCGCGTSAGGGRPRLRARPCHMQHPCIANLAEGTHQVAWRQSLAISHPLGDTRAADRIIAAIQKACNGFRTR